MSIIVGSTYWQYIENRFRLGKPEPDGGNTICRTGGGVAWIVAPNTSEVSRTWYSINDAVTTATNCTSATGWFVPTVGQLQNPGYCCKTYWDSYSSSSYWSSSNYDTYRAWSVNFISGTASVTGAKTSVILCVRAFRCVCY